MGHIQDRWYKTIIDPDTGKPARIKTDLYGKGLRYKVRYLDPDGKEVSRSFPDRAKRQADEFLHKVENDKRDGNYLDPNAAKTKFKDYAEQWLAGQSFKSTTRVNVPSRLKSQAYPFLGNIELGAITPTTVRNWIRWMKDHGTAQSYRHVCFVHVSAILSAAVDDRKIATNPCKARSVTKPTPGQRKIVPWTDARIRAVRLALEPLVKIAVHLGAGAGLRQGEMFGLSPDDIDRDAQVLHIVRQVQQTNNKLIFCLPKRDKVRDVPLSAGTLAALDDYMQMFPPVSVVLPWEEEHGKLTAVDLIMTDDEGRPWWRQVFNREYWRPALDRADVTNATREDGTHALRHYYASALLEGGVSIKALSEYLGHADPGFTLRTYTHLMPASHDRTRRLIDARIARPDGLVTAYEGSEEENSRSDGVGIRTGSTGTG
jgi:integrase